MVNMELSLSDERLLEIHHQVRDWRAGTKLIPTSIIRLLPKGIRKGIEMKLNPPSLDNLAHEVAVSLDLKGFELDLFQRGFWWRVNILQYLDIRKRNSSRSPFFTDPNVKNDPKLLQELKQAENNVKSLIDCTSNLAVGLFSEQDPSVVHEWLDEARSSGSNLGMVFYSPSIDLSLLRSQIGLASARIAERRKKIFINVRAYLCDGLEI